MAGTAAPRVLVTSADPAYAGFMRTCLGSHGAELLDLPTAEEALPELDVVLADLSGPANPGWKLIERVRETAPLVEIVAIVSGPEVAEAVGALRAGAFTVLEYPVSSERLIEEVTLACERKRRGAERMRQLDASRETRRADRLSRARGTSRRRP